MSFMFRIRSDLGSQIRVNGRNEFHSGTKLFWYRVNEILKLQHSMIETLRTSRSR